MIYDKEMIALKHCKKMNANISDEYERYDIRKRDDCTKAL